MNSNCESRQWSPESGGKVERFVPIAGKWTPASLLPITFKGVIANRNELPDEDAQPYGLAIAPGKFIDGTIECKMRFNSPAGRSSTGSDDSWVSGVTGGVLFSFNNDESRYYVAHIGGFDKAFGVLQFEPGQGWRDVVSLGSVQNLLCKEYSIKVAVVGQKVSIAFDGVDVLVDYVLPQPLDGKGFGLFGWGRSDVEFLDLCVARDCPKVFVVMPFSEPFDTLYHAVIRKIALDEKLDIVRVDEIRGPGNILEDIRRQISSAHVIVAEISLPNPNVFYEVGYAHALNKPVILLARRNQGVPLPFDLRPYRVIFYDDTIGGKDEVERVLREHFKSVLR